MSKISSCRNKAVVTVVQIKFQASAATAPQEWARVGAFAFRKTAAQIAL